MPPSAKCFGCHLGPAAEQRIVDRDELDLGEALEVRRIGRSRVGRTVEVLGDDLLALVAVEVLEIGLGDLARALLVDVLVDQRDRRLGLDRGRRHDDVELVGAEFVERQEGLVLPGEQHVADAALGEGGGRAAGAGIEHRDVLVELGDEVDVLRLRRRRTWCWPRPRRRGSSSARRPRSSGSA